MEATYTAEELAAMPDRIAATFSGRSVFVTGGTGFIGKVLVEKLLRKCPDIKQIMLLVRLKKGKMPVQRMKDTLNDPLFEKVRTMRGGLQPLLDKMTLIAGDAAEPDLGLSLADRQRIIDEANIVIHVAGSIRFDEELKKAVLLNVRGTKLVIQLARECKNLLLLIHTSTAYCHPHEKLLEEKPYPPPADPHQIIQTMELMDEAMAAAVTPMLLQNVPNAYTFTKALAEALAIEAMKDLPVIVLRPSIVIPIYKEPIPGWTDNINGPSGLLIATGKGVLRSMYCNQNFYADYLPVDIFVNSIMIFAWEYIEQRVNNITVINVTSSAEIKVTWSEMIETGREILNHLPLNGVAWYPGGTMTNSRLYHNIRRVLYHWLPAILVDCLLFCLGYKPVLCRVQRRIYKGIKVFEYYTNNQWDFQSDVVQTVRKTLNAREKQDYKVDTAGLNVKLYFEDCILSGRRYILKETDDTIPAARRHMKVVNNITVINVTSSAEIKVTWSEMIETGREILNHLPLNGVAWYPGGTMTNSRLYHNIRRVLYHWLPAILVDCLLFCLGYKPVLCRVQRRIYKGIKVFEYYTNNQWDFQSDVVQTVRKTLNAREKQDYKVDTAGLNVKLYFEDCILSGRRYILKETDDTIPAARRHMKVMWCVDVAFRVIFWGLMLYWLSGWFTPLFSSSTALAIEPEAITTEP